MDFLVKIELTEFTNELYEQACNNIDTMQFDAFNFEQILVENSLQFLAFKIFK